MSDHIGLLHIYYGDGKGKTTAAFGLALRCTGRGRRGVIAQFLTGGGSGEVSAVQRFPEILLLRGEGPNKFTFQMNGEEKSQTAAACLTLFRSAAEQAVSENARLLVLDELIDACSGFLPLEEVTSFLDGRPAGLEVVITGHSLPKALAERADYISHVVKEKHPYDRGVMARPDIEF